MPLTPEQQAALKQLDAALTVASNCGLLDELLGQCASRASINDVVDAVDATFAALLPVIARQAG